MANLSSAPRTRWFGMRLGWRFWTLAAFAVTTSWGTNQFARQMSVIDDETDLEASLYEGRPQPAGSMPEITKAALAIAPLQVAKKTPQSNDWLDRHAESGQTFAEYGISRPPRPTERLTTLYVQTIGPTSAAHQRIAEQTTRFLGDFFGVPSLLRPTVDLRDVPADAKSHPELDGDEQLLCGYFLYDLLPSIRPKDAVAFLGLTGCDVSPGDDWSYVFGQALLQGRVAIHSWHRYGDPAVSDDNYQRCLERTLKVTVHETGHMFGLTHCAKYECSMNGTNHVEELDRTQLGFCSECEQKVWWACGMAIARRYELLIQFARDNQLTDAENRWQRALDLIAP